MPDLEKWIQEQLDSGYSQQQILQSLLDSGYSEQKARSALQKVLNQRKQTKPMLSQHKGLISLLIILLIISAAAAYLYPELSNSNYFKSQEIEVPNEFGNFHKSNMVERKSQEDFSVSYKCPPPLNEFLVEKEYEIIYKNSLNASLIVRAGFPKDLDKAQRCLKLWKNYNFENTEAKISSDSLNIDGLGSPVFIKINYGKENMRMFSFIKNNKYIILSQTETSNKNLLSKEKFTSLAQEFGGYL